VGRPRSPLITRERVIEASLVILRKEGVAALTLRRIGQEVGVNAASIYHHFEGKDEILQVIVRTALEQVTMPEFDGDLRSWLIEVNMRHYRFFVANAFLVPLLAQGYLPRVTYVGYSEIRDRMHENGISPSVSELFIEAVETLVLGGALLASRVNENKRILRQPVKSNGKPSVREKRFEATVALLVDSSLVPAS
jgi:TetR/AcrR family transcriptional regulator, tetracycline repressor protein